MNSEEKETDWGKTERGKEGQPFFMESSCDDGRRHTLISLSLLFPFCLPLDHDQGR
jgi:hypothetical protein